MFKFIKLRVIGLGVAIAMALAAGYLGVPSDELKASICGTQPIEGTAK